MNRPLTVAGSPSMRSHSAAGVRRMFFTRSMSDAVFGAGTSMLMWYSPRWYGFSRGAKITAFHVEGEAFLRRIVLKFTAQLANQAKIFPPAP